MGAGSSSGNKKGQLLETLADHEESINCMVISEDGSMLVTGSEDATARYRHSQVQMQLGTDIAWYSYSQVQA
jgi:WD40 repeat protein